MTMAYSLRRLIRISPGTAAGEPHARPAQPGDKRREQAAVAAALFAARATALAPSKLFGAHACSSCTQPREIRSNSSAGTASLRSPQIPAGRRRRSRSTLSLGSRPRRRASRQRHPRPIRRTDRPRPRRSQSRAARRARPPAAVDPTPAPTTAARTAHPRAPPSRKRRRRGCRLKGFKPTTSPRILMPGARPCGESGALRPARDSSTVRGKRQVRSLGAQHPCAVLTGDDPEAVVLDFVQRS
jgi:hypothetical protein